MNVIRQLVFIPALFLAACAGPDPLDVAQQKSLRQQVVGTWRYVSVDIVRPDGSRAPLFGKDPKGLAVFDGGGRYILMTTRSDQAKFGSTNRMEGTVEENKAVVQGSIAHFGSYSVDEAEKTITFWIANSTFPNWNGTEQKRPIVVSGDELKWITPASTGSGFAEVLLRRVR